MAAILGIDTEANALLRTMTVVATKRSGRPREPYGDVVAPGHGEALRRRKWGWRASSVRSRGVPWFLQIQYDCSAGLCARSYGAPFAFVQLAVLKVPDDDPTERTASKVFTCHHAAGRGA